MVEGVASVVRIVGEVAAAAGVTVAAAGVVVAGVVVAVVVVAVVAFVLGYYEVAFVGNIVVVIALDKFGSFVAGMVD